MKKVAAVLAGVMFSSASAFAGTISFTPQGPTDVLEGESIQYVVGLSDFGFDTFSAIVTTIGVNGGPAVSFDVNTDFFNLFPPTFLAIDAATGTFDSDVKLDGFNFVPMALPQANIGTLTIDTTGAAIGQYDILVAGGLGPPTGGTEDAVAGGTARFSVVPEPATISLLALGAIGLIRRRKHA